MAAFELEWRAGPLPAYQALAGLALTSVERPDRTCPDPAQGGVDVHFAFGTGRVTVFHALDENRLGFGPPDARERSRRILCEGLAGRGRRGGLRRVILLGEAVRTLRRLGGTGC
ncbi:hypothetical protein [Streptomyces sp. NPDC086023]|uniref:hypothetical protein n=1 Tax=Streptomyces sp. NPDC086023 TaxID=3365746 RepID=UPI0037D913A1